MSPFTKRADGTMVYEGQVYSRVVLPPPAHYNDKNGPSINMDVKVVRKAKKLANMTEKGLAEKAQSAIRARKKTALREKLGEVRISPKMKREHPEFFSVTEAELKHELGRMNALIEKWETYEMSRIQNFDN